MRTSSQPDCGLWPVRRCSLRSPAALKAGGRGKIPQLQFASSAIDGSLVLDAVPNTAASLADFQMNAQIHGNVSLSTATPGRAILSLFICRGKWQQTRRLRILKSCWGSAGCCPLGCIIGKNTAQTLESRANGSRPPLQAVVELLPLSK